MKQEIRQGYMFGLVVLIFFFNRLFLPFNIQWSILLLPFFLYYIFTKNRLHHTLKMLLFLLGFGLLSIGQSMHWSDYILSTGVMAAMVVFTHSFYIKSLEVKSFDEVFKKVTIINLILTLMACIALLLPWLKPYFWYLIPFTTGYEAIPRLKLFELEASHYSLALLPLFLYYFWLVLKKFERRYILLLTCLSFSLLMSFSLGVLGVAFLSIFLVLFFYFYQFIRKDSSRKLLTGAFFTLIILFVVAWILFPENPLFFRIANVFDGEDTSGRGRTYEAFIIGWKVLVAEGKTWFGIGLGQFKYLGEQILNDFYQYSVKTTVIRLPNCMAETMVAYGLVGLVLKIAIQLYLFFKTKVHANVFRVSLFLALFIYQFTGSFLFNSMEYILWVLIFIPRFSQFDKEVYFKQ